MNPLSDEMRFDLSNILRTEVEDKLDRLNFWRLHGLLPARLGALLSRLNPMS